MWNYVHIRSRIPHQIDVADATGVFLTESGVKKWKAASPFFLSKPESRGIWVAPALASLRLLPSTSSNEQTIIAWWNPFSVFFNIFFLQKRNLKSLTRKKTRQGNNWISHPHEMAIRRREKNKRDRWKDRERSEIPFGLWDWTRARVWEERNVSWIFIYSVYICTSSYRDPFTLLTPLR